MSPTNPRKKSTTSEKSTSKQGKPQKEKQKSDNDTKTLTQIISEINFKKEVSSKESQTQRRNSAFTSRTQRSNSESYLNHIKERNKLLKPKIIIKEDGKIVVEQPKISEVNEKMGSNTNMSIVEDNEKLTSLSFKKITPFKKWSKEETDMFYKGLECFGTDFSLLSYVFPGRNRNQLKNKLHKEENMNSDKVKVHLSRFDNEKLRVLIPFLLSKRRKNDEKDKKDEGKNDDLKYILLSDMSKKTSNINLKEDEVKGIDNDCVYVDDEEKEEKEEKENNKSRRKRSLRSNNNNEENILEKFISTFL